MIKEGTVAQVEALERVIKTLEYELLHDGGANKEQIFADQGDSRVFYRLYEIYTEPTGFDIVKMVTVKSGVVRLFFDYRDGSGLVEMADRDYGNLWEILPFREAVKRVMKNGQ